ncbi:MAG: GTPase Obg [Tepidiforma sp.]|uniref:GTPase Obg n=1 Tax=Tepidiforma bonchosmolovskayae TaxID=2601677 RepID=A0ABX6C0X9_9CHLR|nr:MULTISPECIES: GTPase ObgE [Tepidiforma]QFG02941.1 GTPase ObgE [Tepidiforma bonchosmolovskayae]GIW14562.1 MAG: GTPase Obg [Tepidiforma sp.]
MLDAVEITVKGGNGGHGLVSYHREKFVPQGGPDGGDGGRGGRIFLRAVDDVYTLELYRSRKRFQAGAGGNGGPNLRHGANGEDLYLEVPVGTVVYDAETGDLLADLSEVGAEVLVAHGGRGGWGNKRFATPTNQTPGYSQKGQEGEERRLRLELRLLADVGLIGLPNAGKSTLLAAVSNAKPKIASYPFTTLEPMLGVVNVGWERFTLADLPGLVEGASEGYGLGFEFLKHVRRCRVLLHVVSCESPDPVTDYELIEGELRAYDPGLEHVARVVAVTKADLDHAAAERSAEALAAHLGRPVRVISAHDGTGLEPLKEELMALVAAERARAASQPPAEVPVIRPAPVDRFVVTIDEDGRYVVDGYTAVTFVKMMDTGMPGALDEVMRRLERWGIAKELRRLGIKPGDVVVFDDVEIAWEG